MAGFTWFYRVSISGIINTTDHRTVRQEVQHECILVCRSFLFRGDRGEICQDGSCDAAWLRAKVSGGFYIFVHSDLQRVLFYSFFFLASMTLMTLMTLMCIFCNSGLAWIIWIFRACQSDEDWFAFAWIHNLFLHSNLSSCSHRFGHRTAIGQLPKPTQRLKMNIHRQLHNAL